MPFVGRLDWAFADPPMPASPTSSGLARRVLVGRNEGAVHTELAAGSLEPGGWAAPHIHSFEQSLYVPAGGLLLEVDGRVHRLHAAEYALVPIGVRHTLGNAAGEP